MKCKCGNSFDPEGFYCGMCTGCSSDFCEDCLLGCECGKQWCSECMKECSVEGCDKILCDRCDCSVKCERCSERVCEDTCTREVGNSRFTLTWCIDCEEQERRRWWSNSLDGVWLGSNRIVGSCSALWSSTVNWKAALQSYDSSLRGCIMYHRLFYLLLKLKSKPQCCSFINYHFISVIAIKKEKLPYTPSDVDTNREIAYRMHA